MCIIENVFDVCLVEAKGCETCAEIAKDEKDEERIFKWCKLYTDEFEEAMSNFEEAMRKNKLTK